MLLKLSLLLACCLLVGLYSSCGSNNNSNSQTGNISTTTTTTQTAQPAGVNQSSANTNALPTTPASQPTGGIDACSLLDGKEIAKVQGGAIKETKSSQRNDGDFLMSQCFYTAEEFVRSVSLSVVQPHPANPAKQPREYFTERFARAGEKSGEEREREKEREHEKAKEQSEKEKGAGQQERGEEEEEEGGNAERVSGVGEQAYWVKTGPSASLYVLQKNQFLILSIGGGDAEQVKLRKTKALAQQALKRMK
jgi:hypothetical protein